MPILSFSADSMQEGCISGLEANEVYCMRSPRSRTCIGEVHKTDQPASFNANRAEFACSGSTAYNDMPVAPESIYSESVYLQRSTLSYAGPKEKLNNAIMSRSFDTESPVVPTRPPLKPTVSYGGVSNVSYYSTASSSLAQKSKAVALEEELRSIDHAPIRSYACTIIFCLLSFTCGLNITFLATALPAIAYRLNLSAVQSFWIINGYLLTSTFIQPLCMRVSPTVGIKLTLSSGLSLWLVGSMMSALSGVFSVVLIGQILSGLGAGAVGVLVQLAQQHMNSPEGPSKLEQAVSSIFWLGVSLGPIVGGAIVHAVSWHYIFYVNIPFLVVGIISLPFLLRLPYTDGSKLANLIKVDFCGWLLLTGSISSLILAVSWAGTTYTWTSWHTLVPCIIGFVALLCWITYSRYWRDPILPVSIFRTADVAVWCFGSMVHGMALTSIIYLMPYYLATAANLSPIVTGAALGSWTFAILITASIFGMTRFTSAYRRSLCFGWLFVTIGLAHMQLLRENARFTYLPVGIATGLALGVLLPNHITAIQHSASNDDETIYAAALHNFFSALGHSLGIAIGSGVLLNRLESWKHVVVPINTNSGVLANNIVQMAHLIRNTSKSEADLPAKLQSSYIDSLRWVWAMMCMLAAVTLLLSVWHARGRCPHQSSDSNSA